MIINARNARTLPAGRHTVDGCPTLTLVVQPGGARSWVQRLMLHGRRIDRGLGSLDFVSVAEAKQIAARNRYAARRGDNPFLPRAADKTFGDAADATLAANRDRWAATSVKTFNSMMRAVAALRGVPLAKLTRADVISVLSRIAGRSVSQARKARKAIRQVIEVAMANGWMDDNVANGGVDAALPMLREAANPTVHHAADYRGLPSILAALPDTPAGDLIRFIALTGCRNSEGRLVTWEEVNLDAAVWTIPAGRTKSQREHRIPLSAAAVSILRKYHCDAAAGFIFRGQRTGPMDATTIQKIVRPHNVKVHGFRGALRSWAADKGTDAAVAEGCIGHVSGTVTERAYQVSDLLERRRPVMADWGAFLFPGR